MCDGTHPASIFTSQGELAKRVRRETEEQDEVEWQVYDSSGLKSPNGYNEIRIKYWYVNCMLIIHSSLVV